MDDFSRSGQHFVDIIEKAGVRQSACLVKVVVSRRYEREEKIFRYRKPYFFLKCGKLRIPARGFCRFEELRRRLKERGLVMAVCGNCRYFDSFGMVENVSYGQAGFCLRPEVGREGGESGELKSIEDSCSAFEFESAGERSEEGLALCDRRSLRELS